MENTENKSYLGSTEQWSEEAGQMTQGRSGSRGEFQGQKDQQADTLGVLHNSNICYDSGVYRKGRDTGKDAGDRKQPFLQGVFQQRSLSFPLAQYNAFKQLPFHRPLK